MPVLRRERRRPSAAMKLMRDAGVDPLDPYPGSKEPWRCKCMNCGKTVTPCFNRVQQGQGGCRYCSGTAPVDPQTAVEDMNAAGFEPLEPYPGASWTWKSQCLDCGKVSHPRLSTVRRGHRCQHCAGNALLDSELAAAKMREAGLEPLVPYPGSRSPGAVDA